MLASDKYGLHGRNWSTRFTYGWMSDLGIYRLTGTVRHSGGGTMEAAPPRR
jgi:RNA-directed DNA polymerase